MLLKTGHLAFGDFVLDPDEKTLTQAGEPVLLTPKALQLLLVLAENAGQIVEKGDLIDRVWPGAFVEDGILGLRTCSDAEAFPGSRKLRQ